MKMMNSFCRDLQFTSEIEGDFTYTRIPSLDITTWMEEDNVCRYSFYEKPMATKKTIEKNTTISENQKKAILTAEVVRRMLSMDGKMEQEEKDRVMDDFGENINRCGYTLEERRNILMNGILGYERKIER